VFVSLNRIVLCVVCYVYGCVKRNGAFVSVESENTTVSTAFEIGCTPNAEATHKSFGVLQIFSCERI